MVSRSKRPLTISKGFVRTEDLYGLICAALDVECPHEDDLQPDELLLLSTKKSNPCKN